MKLVKFEGTIKSCEDCPYRKLHQDMDGSRNLCNAVNLPKGDWFGHPIIERNARYTADEKIFPDFCPLEDVC